MFHVYGSTNSRPTPEYPTSALHRRPMIHYMRYYSMSNTVRLFQQTADDYSINVTHLPN